MVPPVVVFLGSTFAVLACALLPGAGDYLLIAAPAALASLILLLWAIFRQRHKAARALPPSVLVDGSNVMHWDGGTPRLETLRLVLTALQERGLDPWVVFDANVGYKIAGSFRSEAALAALLGLPLQRVTVVPRGTPADPVLLGLARQLGVAIVSNDRFRDWTEAHPAPGETGWLIRGGLRDGALWLAPS